MITILYYDTASDTDRSFTWGYLKSIKCRLSKWAVWILQKAQCYQTLIEKGPIFNSEQ